MLRETPKENLRFPAVIMDAAAGFIQRLTLRSRGYAFTKAFEVSHPVYSYFKRVSEIKLRGFDPYKEVKRLDGTALEVGGPTENGYDVFALGRLKQLLVTNITSLQRYMDGEAFLPSFYHAETRFQHLDVFHLTERIRSYGYERISVIFASGLTADSHIDSETTSLRESFLTQAHELLMDEGLVVFQHVNKRNIEFAVDLGFEIALQRTYYDAYNEVFVYHVILRKR